ncbi:CPXV205 protein, partial [Monkeypox virus]
MYSGIYPIVL